MEKYRLTDETMKLGSGVVLRRIEALKDFGDIRKGDKGGFIEKESNLSMDGNAWVSGDARLSTGNGRRRRAVLIHPVVWG